MFGVCIMEDWMVKACHYFLPVGLVVDNDREIYVWRLGIQS